MRKWLARPEFAPAVLTLLALILGGVTNRSFFDLRYLLDTGTLYAEIALMALGMTLVIVSGNIDLSPASNLAFVACLVARVAGPHTPAAAAVAEAVAAGAVLGATNGILVAYGRLPSFLVTLGTLALFRGGAQALVHSDSAASPPALGHLDQIRIVIGPFGIPVPLLVVLTCAIAIGLLLHTGIFGKWVYVTGLNEEAAKYSAVPTKAVKFWCFTILGALAGLGAVLMTSRLGVARYDLAQGQELDVITATVLGGSSIAGGRGTIIGTMLAVALIAVARTGMGLSNVSAEYQLAVIGALLIVAVMASGGLERLSRWTRLNRITT